jgi:hypothetical protein
MVNTKGLQRRSTYEEVMEAIQADTFKDAIKTPDRLATFVLEAPRLQALDPENEEAILEFEKKKRLEQARKAAVEEEAQRRGVPMAELEMLTRPPRNNLLEEADDGLERRRYEQGITNAAQVYATEQARAVNVERIRDRVSEEHTTNVQDPIARLVGDTIFYDIASRASSPARSRRSTPSPPRELELDLHFPDTPSRMGTVASEAGNIARESASTALMVGRHITPHLARGLMEATRVAINHGPTAVELGGRALGLVARGLLSGGQAATRAALAAGEVVAAQEPASHRGRDFQQAHGITRVTRQVSNVLLARHALR